MTGLLENSTSGARVRILHVTAIAETAAIIVGPLALHQLRVGYTVEFACAPGRMTDALAAAGIAIHSVPFSRRLLSFSHFFALLKLIRLMRSRRYDVVHAHTPVAAFIARIAAKMAGIPIIVYHLRGSFWDEPSRAVRLAYTAIEWLGARVTTYAFTINCIDREELVRRGIFPPDRVTCLHAGGSGVDVERFAPGNITCEEQRQLRRELGIEADELVIGYVGRLVRAKGIINLLDAFETLVIAHPEARLLLIGSTHSSERDKSVQKILLQRLNGSSLANRVVLTGARTDIPSLLSIIDILVLPSYREGFGMTLGEASAMQRAVIATATRGAREIVQDGVTGRLVPVADTGALVSALKQLAADPHLRDQMGRAGREAVIRCHSMARVCADIDSVYVQLLGTQDLSQAERSR
jgi:glycosyltransferase involved in cell wall biosynthesis